MKKWILSGLALFLIAMAILFGLYESTHPVRPSAPWLMWEMPAPHEKNLFLVVEAVAPGEAEQFNDAGYITRWRVTDTLFGPPGLIGREITVFYNKKALNKETKAIFELWKQGRDAGYDYYLCGGLRLKENGKATGANRFQTTAEELRAALQPYPSLIANGRRYYLAPGDDDSAYVYRFQPVERLGTLIPVESDPVGELECSHWSQPFQDGLRAVWSTTSEDVMVTGSVAVRDGKQIRKMHAQRLYWFTEDYFIREGEP